VQTSPGLTGVLTNVGTIANPVPTKTVTIHPTGAWHFASRPGGTYAVTMTGVNEVVFFLEIEGRRSSVLLQSRFTTVFSAEGERIAPFTGSGQVTDLCSALI